MSIESAVLDAFREAGTRQWQVMAEAGDADPREDERFHRLSGELDALRRVLATLWAEDSKQAWPDLTNPQANSLGRVVAGYASQVTLADVRVMFNPFDLPTGYVLFVITHSMFTGGTFAGGISPEGDVST